MRQGGRPKRGGTDSGRCDHNHRRGELKVRALTQQTSNTVTIGKVISQDPASGSSVAEGSQVNLVISSGPQMVAVPTVEGLTQDAATTAINRCETHGGDHHPAEQ